MNTILHFFSEHVGRLADTLGAVALAYFGWWLGDKARNRAERKADRAALRVQADALVVAVLDVRASALTGHALWDSIWEHARTALLASLVGAGGLVRAKAAGASDRAQIAAALGAAGEVIGRDRIASKQYAATVREPLRRLATAAAPLLHHSDTAVSESASTLMKAATTVKKDTTELDAALVAFHSAVTAAEQAPAPRWRRLSVRRGRSADAVPEQNRGGLPSGG
ncbi:hypothetical protein [Streptomyces sp. DT195]|uniref:hypothetical protein n=1 Tax=Streptomyces sp. DT195 TaxID=3393419 RepID=UPI003CE69007